MVDTVVARKGFRAALGAFVLSLSFNLPAWAADQPASSTTLPPAVLTINPPGRTNPNSSTVSVTLTPPSGVTFAMTAANANQFTSVPAVISVQGPTLSTDKKTITATLKLSENATGSVRLILTDTNGDVYAGNFDTGVVCLESIQKTGCALRWEVITSSASGSTSQSKTQTSPNIMFKLDYQFHSPHEAPSATSNTKDLLKVTNPANPVPAEKANAGSLKIQDICAPLTTFLARTTAQTAPCTPPAPTPLKQGEKAATSTEKGSNFMAHAIFDIGYTQVPATTNLQTSTTSGGTATASTAAVSPRTTASGGSTAQSTQCSSSGSGSAGTCASATQQQAFVADLKLTAGWTVGQNGQHIYNEFGFGARGSFQDLIQANQIVQNGSIQYIDLSSANLKNTSFIYEAVGRYSLSSPGHDVTASTTTGKYNHNVSNLLLLEAGYQNNSALQGLAANPTTSTRNRFVLRFSAYPEIPGTNHTKALVGFEYSGGINGGAKVAQIFFGGNLNLPKLFQSGPQTSTPTNSGN